jgi:hypothetical protein
MLSWLFGCTKKVIQDAVQTGKYLQISVAAIVGMGMLHLGLPTGAGVA